MRRFTIANLQKKARKGEKIVMVTSYDATFARLVEEAGVDAILIGDSLGMVIQGHDHTIPVTLEDVIYHSRAVARGCRRPHLVGDLPFGSYQVSVEEALSSAARLMKEGGVQSVKLEGGERSAEAVTRMTQAGIPVMGHIGLTPQSVHQLSGYRVQGRTDPAAEQLMRDATALEEAGCYAIVLEGIPASLAARVTEALRVPTIGIGAGPECDGQVLVIQDLLGLDNEFNPRFLKKYARLHDAVVDAVRDFGADVRGGAFPTTEHALP